MPDVIAETVVEEAERYLKADLPADFADRLAAKAYHIYPRNSHFKKVLNGSGNRGRDSLYMFMRHWTAAWMRRECFTLYKRMPRGYSLGLPLPLN